MKKITVVMSYDIALPVNLQEATKEEIMVWMEEMYSKKGRQLLKEMTAALEGVIVTHMDDIPVGCVDTHEGQMVVHKNNSNFELLLDGQPDTYRKRRT